MDVRPLSKSSIDTFRQCQLKYYLKYMEKVDFPERIPSTLGNLFHGAVESCANFYVETGEYIPCHNYVFVNDAWYNSLSTEQRNILGSPDFNLVQKWLLDFKPRMDFYMSKKILGIELEFNVYFNKQLEEISEKEYDELDNLDKFSIKGFIDLALEDDQDTLHFVDFKSGKASNAKSPAALHLDLQPKIYALALRTKFPEYKNIVGTFDYIHSHPAIVSFSDKELDNLKYQIRKDWIKILSTQKPSRPHKKQWFCDWCVKGGYDGEVCGEVYRRVNSA